MVEDIFRSMKSLLDTRPIFHKCDETIRGHVFCSFLALLLRRQVEERLARKKWRLEWADVIRDLDSLVEMEVTIRDKGYVFRGQSSGVAGKAFQACGVALPPPCAKSERHSIVTPRKENRVTRPFSKPQAAGNQQLPEHWWRR